LTLADARLRVRLDRTLSEADRAGLESALSVALPLGTAGVRLDDDGGPGRYRLDGAEPSPRLVAALGAWCAERGVLITELRTAGSSLEERYLELTGGRGADER
jgi:hypothetical protein